MRFSLILTFTASALSIASLANADVTSWLAVGGGFGFQRNDVKNVFDGSPAFTTSLGVGSSPENKLIVGGIFRTTTYFNLGTDLSLAARLATRGFVRGSFGLALDLGVGYRYWRGGDYGDIPLQAVLTLGLPAGLQVGIGGNFWNVETPFAAPSVSHSSLGAFAVVEIDLLRLTLMRKGVFDQYWPNPSPAGSIGSDAGPSF